MASSIHKEARRLAQVASRDPIVVGLSTAQGRFKRWRRWLNSKHTFAGDILDAVEGATLNGPQLSEYMACSVPLHLVDGWSYLARSWDALVKGDRRSAIHLAYYAELRAALSILAAEGIGVFNRRHVALDSAGAVHAWPPSPATGQRTGTHVAVWDLLQAWSEEPGRVVTFLDGITVENRAITSWLDIAVRAATSSAIPVSSSVRGTIAKSWLRAWSVDLESFPYDKTLRNRVSYNPGGIAPPPIRNIRPDHEISEPLFQLWEELRPGAGSVEVSLDTALLKRALRLVQHSRPSITESWEGYISGLSNDASGLLIGSLLSADNSPLLAVASTKASEQSVEPILARACLLLRLASAAAAKLMKEATISRTDLEFWWGPYGENSGFWDSSGEPEAFSDLWMDISEALGEAEGEMAAIREGSVRAVGGVIRAKPSLTEFGRTPLWLLGLK